MKLKLIAALIGATGLFSSASYANDLLDVYEMALANDPLVQKAKANAKAQSLGIDQARARLLPQVGFRAGYAKSDGTSYQFDADTLSYERIDSDTTTFSRDLELTQSLFDLGAWKSLSIAQKQALQADGNYDSAAQALIVRAAQAYFNVLAALDSLEFVEAEKRAIERQLQQTKERFAVGLTAITDVHEAQAQYDNVVAREISAKNNVETTREQLREITGKYHDKLDAVATDRFSTVKPNGDAEGFFETAKEKNLALQVSKIAMDIAKAQIEQAKAGHYPKLTLTGGYGDSLRDSEVNGISFNDQPRGDSASLRLNFSVPLYSGGATSAAIEQAQAYYQVAAQDLEATHRKVTKDVRTAYNQVMADIATYRALEQAVVSAESALKATETGFEVGTRNIVDVLVSTQNLYNAKRNLANVRYRYIVSTLSLKLAAGTLARADIEAINQALN